MEEDEHDQHGLHWAGMLDGRPIAAAGLCIHPDLSSSPDAEAYHGYEHLIEGPVVPLSLSAVE
jgi:hypothetical protein